MVIGENFYYNGKLIAPMDSVINGSVIGVSKATAQETGNLTLRFTRITTPDGIIIPIAAVVKNDNKFGKLLASNSVFLNESGDIDMPVATEMDIVLIQPITVNPEIYITNY
jgi:hypothetical protein